MNGASFCAAKVADDWLLAYKALTVDCLYMEGRGILGVGSSGAGAGVGGLGAGDEGLGDGVEGRGLLWKV